MKLIRNIALTSFLTMAAFSAVTLTSCSKDDSGCAVGYEGSDCKTESRAKFLKSWSANDVPVGSAPAISPYTATIVAGSASVTTVSIGQFSNGYFNNAVIGNVTSSNTLTVSEQAPDNDGYTVSGTAQYSNGILTWNYTIKSPVSGTNPISYNGTWK